MEENKEPKKSANGLILAILLVVAIIIALMRIKENYKNKLILLKKRLLN